MIVLGMKSVMFFLLLLLHKLALVEVLLWEKKRGEKYVLAS